MILDTKTVQRAEAEIDAFIGRQSKKRKEANEEAAQEAAAMWARAERQRQELQTQWAAFHAHMHRLHTSLARDHAEQAAKLGAVS